MGNSLSNEFGLTVWRLSRLFDFRLVCGGCRFFS